METKKIETMIRGCKFASILTKAIFVLMCYFFVGYIYYLIRVIVTPETAFSSFIARDGSILIMNNEVSMSFGSRIEDWMVPNRFPLGDYSLKYLQIVNLIISMFLDIVPLGVITASLIKIFSSIKINQSPFTHTIVSCIKCVGWIVLVKAIIVKDLSLFITSITVFKNGRYSLNLGQVDFLMLLTGAVIIGLAKIFE
ncbi:MAG: hypothetical protein RR444_05905, partial [Oscillospiraceae bacterium]